MAAKNRLFKGRLLIDHARIHSTGTDVVLERGLALLSGMRPGSSGEAPVSALYLASRGALFVGDCRHNPIGRTGPTIPGECHE
jgi:hypothetical protein